MMKPSHYVINVSQNGSHLFRTGSSLTNTQNAREVFLRLCLAFPVSDGYKVDISYWRGSSQPLALEDLED